MFECRGELEEADGLCGAIDRGGRIRILPHAPVVPLLREEAGRTPPRHAQ